MKTIGIAWILLSMIGFWLQADSEAPVSEETEACLECHATTHPGLVANWRAGRHARITPKQAMAVKGLSRKVSSPEIPENLLSVVVGCAECHGLRSAAHQDSFDHNDARIHVVVTPHDCAVCHKEEAEQYSENLMAHARGNLVNNPMYAQLERAISGTPHLTAAGLELQEPDEDARAVTCAHCHGTQLIVDGSETRETDLGEMDFPKIKGWPNQGVGRANPDGSLGSCAACHARHQFSMAMARQPHTCRQCHVGPDVPAYKVYMASKHGNLYATHAREWEFDAVPWTIGRDFAAPTCASCHISLIATPDGDALTARSHRMTDRLARRLFGLVYAHPQPKHPDTSRIRNKDGQSLPTTYDNEPAEAFLIDAKEQQIRTKRMQAVCLGCHDRSWVAEHFRRHQATYEKTNAFTAVATKGVQTAWSKGWADPSNPFDEGIERTWSDVWLMYANTVRFAAAMGGGGDYAVFADGYYRLSQTVTEIHDWLDQRRSPHAPSPAEPAADSQQGGKTPNQN